MAATEPQQFGEFAVIEKLGQGAMGAVYKARQTSLNRIVALKLLPAHYASDADFLTRFKNEAMAAAALNHPHIVQVYAAGEDRGTHFFAMEYVEGESFGARMERKGRIDPREVIAVACHVAQALEYAWRKAKVIHRDIKPDNIFLSREGTVKLGDLGLAKLLGNQGAVTQTGAAMGTPYYVSPEQAMGTKEIDFRADIYSLGCTIYHAISGEPPYRGASAMAVMLQHISQPPPKIHDLWAACPPPLIGLLDRMLRKRPEERHESYAALLEQLFWVAERIDQPAIAEDAAQSLIVPMAVPRSASTPDASRKSSPAPATKATAPQAAPPARSSRKMLAILSLAVMAAIAVFAWQHWKSTVPFPRKDVTAAKTPASPATAAAVPTASIITSDATKEAPFVNTLGMKFVPVPGTKVLFCIHETRKDDYAAYAAENAGVDDGWKNPNREGVPVSFAGDHPVCNVSWEDAKGFCAWLSKKEGRAYRLPTDREWSMAVGIADREDPNATPASLNGRIPEEYVWGKEWPPPKGAGNFADTATAEKLPNQKIIPGYTDGFATTAPVMSFTPNKLGIYDLAGNVWQYCEDWFDAAHTLHTIRGGNWDDGDSSRPFLLSTRFADKPDYRHNTRGFRCVLEADAPSTNITSTTAKIVSNPPIATVVPTPSPTPAPATPTPLPAPAPATPTPAPTAAKSDTTLDAEGFIPLLDRSHTDGWKQVGSGGMKIQEGVATTWVPSNAKPVAGWYFYSKRTFADFTLKLEFKAEGKLSNSGVLVRSLLPSEEVFNRNMKSDHDIGYEVNIAGDLKDSWPTGSVIFFQQPSTVPQKPDDWNEMEITIIGQKQTIKLNGQVVNEFLGNRGADGYIALQNWRPSVQLRNIRVKDLSSPAPARKPKSETEKWLVQMDAIYLPMHQREVTAPYETGMAALKKNYIASLDRENTSASRALKLKEAITFRDERQRFEAEGSVPIDDSIPRTSVLGSLRTAYLAQAARLETDRRKHTVTIFAQYDKVLETNQNALTQRQRLDEALLLQQRREALSKDWGVASGMGAHAGVTVSQPFVNTLGMKFVPVPATRALFSVWDTRVQDYAVYARENTGINMEWKNAESNGESQGPTHPVVNVNWNDAKDFCAWLTRKERAAGKIAATETYRLPTDHEWSCAAGLQENPQALPSVKDAQIKGVYPWGTEWPVPKNAGNYFSTHEYKFTSPVGTFPANRYGLHDMGGNVWQWCDDWYDSKQLGRVLRGGSWNTFDPVNLLSSYRTLINPAYRGGSYGFRCVLDFGAPAK
jgi:formylglycine-generating enzyme required for sulfatase activity/serine/threonine protein kinase